jgi:hypothetical protein
VGYDIYFVRRDPGESFEDALELLEDSYDEGDPGPLTTVELEQWEVLLPQAQEIMGLVEVFEDDRTRELLGVDTGIQLSLFAGEVSVTVPYEHGEDAALAVMHKVYALARAVEDATGLEGYDPQLEEPVFLHHLAAAAARLQARSRPPAPGRTSEVDPVPPDPVAAEPQPVGAGTGSQAAGERPGKWWQRIFRP